MKVLLDTNIIIHREASAVIDEDIGVLFKWLDDLHYVKCIHPVTLEEINKHEDKRVRDVFKVKLKNYTLLQTIAPMSAEVKALSEKLDLDQNDLNDTILLNELYNERVDTLITEDKKIQHKAELLGLADSVFSIDSFLEKVNFENPELADYDVLSVRQSYFGNIDLSDDFFLSFKEDYPGFEKWFNKKANEIAYICLSEGKTLAFLYVKSEGKAEDYSDINPPLSPKKRLKIGSFKVTLNGFRLGERFLKIVFDNAIRLKVDEVYVTIFNKRLEQQRLINLLEEYGFSLHGIKKSESGEELVYLRSCEKIANIKKPKLTYPFFSMEGSVFIVPIYPQYHTELFPDSILKTESPMDFIENEPHRNAISKVYISRSFERDLHSGDIIVFYRTGGYYQSVVTTIGVVEGVIDNINTESDFIRLCRKRSVFTDSQLKKNWRYRINNKPFIVNFLYTYSFPKRINMKRLIELGVIAGVNDAPRGFTKISSQNFRDILKECKADESIIVD